MEELKKELSTLETRWYTFLEKLEQKADEIIAALETEGVQVYKEDEDEFKRVYWRFKSGMDGQLANIRTKANDTCDEQIRYKYQNINVLSGDYTVVFEWRERCLQKHYDWENRLSAKRDQAFDKIEQQEDLEGKYKAILEEYDRIKNQFSCKQCSGVITLDKIFFISTYVTCPYCQTQNTFHPSVQARMLEHIARPLAEQRNLPLYQQYQDNIYQGRYDDKSAVKAGKQKELEAYEKYQRAVFNEINKIIPELKEQNEKFYARLINDYKNYNN